MGQIKADPQFYGYISYILEDNGLLKPVSDVNETVWGIKPKANISIAGLKGKVTYLSSVFVPKTNQIQIIWCFESQTGNQINYHLLYERISSDGIWDTTLHNIKLNIKFKGKFYMNEKIFGVNDSQFVDQILSDGNLYLFIPIVSEDINSFYLFMY
jgi:hypothetical protein